MTASIQTQFNRRALLRLLPVVLLGLLIPAGAFAQEAATTPDTAENAAPPVPLQAALRVQTTGGGIRTTSGTLLSRTASTLNFQQANASAASSIPVTAIQEMIIREPELFTQMDENLVQDNDAPASTQLAQAIRTLAAYTAIPGSNAGDLIGQAVQIFLSRDKSPAALAGLEQAGITGETTRPGTVFARMQALLYAADGDTDTAERLLTDPEAAQETEPQTEAQAQDAASAEGANLRRASVNELEELARGRIALARGDTTAALNHFARVQVLSIPSNPWFAAAMFYSAVCYTELEVPAPADTPNAPAPPQQILQQMQRLFPDSAWTERLQSETGFQM